jgi:hypothetical protein
LNHTILQQDGKTFTKEVCFLLIYINVVRPVLGKGAELSRVFKHSVVPLVKIQELFQLVAEWTRR